MQLHDLSFTEAEPKIGLVDFVLPCFPFEFHQLHRHGIKVFAKLYGSPDGSNLKGALGIQVLPSAFLPLRPVYFWCAVNLFEL
jgi:hypothetical protein